MEREYIVPLRKEFQKAPKYKRTNRAVRALRDFIARHMKSENVSIGKFLNLKLWENGIRNPPHKVMVKAVKDSEGKVVVELKDLPLVREKVNKRLARVERSEGKKTEEPKKETKKSDVKKSDSKDSKKSDKVEKVSENSPTEKIESKADAVVSKTPEKDDSEKKAE